MLQLPPEEFEELVGRALDQLPRELAVLMDNVAVLVEEEHPEEPELLGLYEGVPLTERDQYYFGVLPDRVTIYRRPLLGICGSYDEIVEQVQITVVHEIAHHFGIDDDRLDELGYA